MIQSVKTFKDDVLNNINLRVGTNLQMFINESTDLILDARNDNKEEVKNINLEAIEIGRFYLIRYNYNGNQIWCPIFSLEYKYYNQKSILYAINLDYLPYLYKIELFNVIWLKQREVFEFNQKVTKIEEERRLKIINFEDVYKLLKKNGNYEYCITAFDMTKIKEVNLVSYNLMGRFIMITTRNLNSRSMRDLYDKETNIEIKEKIDSILKQYEGILNEYSDDSKEFYKKLKNFESHLKLIKEK